MAMSLSNLTASQLRQAASLKDKIEALKKQLAGIAGETATKTTNTAPAAKKIRRRMSAAARAKIGDAQRKRWAKLNASKTGLKIQVPKFRPGKGLKDAVN